VHYHAIEKQDHYSDLHSFDAFILSFWRLEANSMSFGNLCKSICLVCMDKSSFSYCRLQRNMNMKGEMISCKNGTASITNQIQQKLRIQIKKSYKHLFL
jgi:hypothetical protein